MVIEESFLAGEGLLGYWEGTQRNVGGLGNVYLDLGGDYLHI